MNYLLGLILIFLIQPGIAKEPRKSLGKDAKQQMLSAGIKLKKIYNPNCKCLVEVAIAGQDYGRYGSYDSEYGYYGSYDSEYGYYDSYDSEYGYYDSYDSEYGYYISYDSEYPSYGSEREKIKRIKAKIVKRPRKAKR